MDEVASALTALSQKLNFTYIFKASFDKANRQAIESYRGPGLEKALSWFSDIKMRHKCKITTDVHEVHQVHAVSQVIDVLQIPAFLCRQTDLILAAVQTGKFVNIKKGQFMSPHAMIHVVNKARAAISEENKKSQTIALTERGACFGYGDLVVDMRSFSIMSETKVPLIFDITHSTQRPGTHGSSSSSYTREFAPLLARSAAATGKLSGFFLEVHPNPSVAKSDAGAQLSIAQAELLLEQLIPLWRESKKMQKIDEKFTFAN
jgi:2-dehydro-3-deoxyphosphooctonate aldolase (KDO 8-P synthase)